MALGPFFVFTDGTALKKSRFDSITREALEELGLPQELFAIHSFLIGAVTAAAKSGLEDSWIKTLGKWKSTTFIQYIQTLLDSLTATSALLVRSSSQINDPGQRWIDNGKITIPIIVNE